MARVTHLQKIELDAFLKLNTHLLADDSGDCKEIWEVIAETLNSFPDSVTYSWREWKQIGQNLLDTDCAIKLEEIKSETNTSELQANIDIALKDLTSIDNFAMTGPESEQALADLDSIKLEKIDTIDPNDVYLSTLTSVSLEEIKLETMKTEVDLTEAHVNINDYSDKFSLAMEPSTEVKLEVTESNPSVNNSLKSLTHSNESGFSVSTPMIEDSFLVQKYEESHTDPLAGFVDLTETDNSNSQAAPDATIDLSNGVVDLDQLQEESVRPKSSKYQKQMTNDKCEDLERELIEIVCKYEESMSKTKGGKNACLKNAIAQLRYLKSLKFKMKEKYMSRRAFLLERDVKAKEKIAFHLKKLRHILLSNSG